MLLLDLRIELKSQDDTCSRDTYKGGAKGQTKYVCSFRLEDLF